MKVQLGTKTYIIRWHHKRDAVDNRTECIVSEVQPDNTTKDIASGEAFCNAVDNYDKNTGRKISLTRALTLKVPQVSNPAADWVPLFSHEDRATVWSTYHKMRGRW